MLRKSPIRKVSRRKSAVDRADESDRKLLKGVAEPKCRVCGTRDLLHVHHIFSRQSSPHLRHYLPNLILLCAGHHKMIHDLPKAGKLIIVGIIGYDAYEKLERLANQRKSERSLA